MTSGSSGRPEILTPRARALLPVFLLVLLFFAVRQLWWTAPERLVLSGSTMGTTWTVTLNAPEKTREDVQRVQVLVEERLAAINRSMSTWDESSELSRFNRFDSTAPFPVSPEMLAVVRLARDVSERTGGAFDVTVRPLVAAWGFGAGARIGDPDAAELAALRERVGYAALSVEDDALRKRRADLEVDLSAVAKGFGVDEVADVLGAEGYADYFVEIGGEVRVRGERRGGGPWRVGIERPDTEGRSVVGVVLLSDAAMATSGDYRNFYDAGGERRTHIIDPRTGRPVTHGLASVSVVHAEAAVADAWATALLVLGPEEGPACAEAEGVAAYFIVRREGEGFDTSVTTGFPAIEVAPGDPLPSG